MRMRNNRLAVSRALVSLMMGAHFPEYDDIVCVLRRIQPNRTSLGNVTMLPAKRPRLQRITNTHTVIIFLSVSPKPKAVFGHCN